MNRRDATNYHNLGARRYNMSTLLSGLYPIGRCNNCEWYYHENPPDLTCPNCATDEYLMDMPELANLAEAYQLLCVAAARLERYPQARDLILTLLDKCNLKPLGQLYTTPVTPDRATGRQGRR